jgi:DNA-binding SARP family transcriptional activator
MPGVDHESAPPIVMVEIRLHLFGEASVEIGEEVIGPAAPHLFALLLLLTLAPADGVSRQELRELLFGRTEERAASQRLRQLLYRLRQLGVDLCDTAGGSLRVGNSMIHVPPASGNDAGPLRALPHYRPRLPKAFLAWLEQTREQLEQRTQTQLVRELREAHRRQDWSKASGLATVVLAADPLNEEVAAAGVESRAMLGQRDEALELADRFVRDVEADEPAAAAMRRLRARIAKTSLTRREGTLRGREECLQLLADQWEQSAIGGGRVCLVVGPAGMGKTRVAETFAAKVRLGGGRVVTYRCDRQVSQHPLALFAAILPELQGLPGSLGISPANREALERLNPSLNVSNAEMPGLSTVEARRTELQRALIDLLEAVSAERRLMIVVDDAHLLDEASTDVLRAIGDSHNGTAILIAGFARPRTEGARLANARRATSYLLPPLTELQAGDLLLELRDGKPLSREQHQWALAQARGNPFYVHALSSAPLEKGTLPTHVRSMATGAYFGLAPGARTVLESCLLLETLATLGRIRVISGLDDSALVSALRELDEADLVQLDAHSVRGPHAILDEVLRELIPPGVATLLHMKIAERLAAECTTSGYSMSLAWAAVKSWLFAGDSQAAIALARRAAREAADIGEPQAGAELLSQIPRKHLPLECQRQLLDDLYDLARIGNCQTLLLESLTERMTIAVAQKEEPQIQANLRLGLIANSVQNGSDRGSSCAILTDILNNANVKSATRIEAAKYLIALADLALDSVLARTIYAFLVSEFGSVHSNDPTLTDALLIYDTVFGDSDRAYTVAANVLSRVSLAHQRDRSLALNSCLALSRLGQYAEASALASSIFDQTFSRGLLSSAEFALSMITEAEVATGNWGTAAEWLARWECLAEKRRPYQSRFFSGYVSSKYAVLLHEQRYTEARGFANDNSLHGFLTDARFRALSLSHSIILQYRMGESLSEEAIGEVRTLYDRGRSLGGQDICVEALWSADTFGGRQDSASCLLREYLCLYRRERGPAGWNLRSATASDPAWLESPPHLALSGAGAIASLSIDGTR